MVKYWNGACNPYLPAKEYVPDGEPHVFGDRLYVFGSHDEVGGDNYCTGPYVGWSAPLADLSDWRYEGVILEKGQDPYDPEGKGDYYAPDAAQGPDGRYYLYYSIGDSQVVSVAVAEGPAGPYHFYGHVKDAAGHVLGAEEGEDLQFDPAILVDDDGRIWLYSGQGMPVEEMDGRKVKGSQVCELEPDMITMKTPQRVITSRQENCFEENPFFEASSIRKIDGKYYFIYSPLPNVHNLCYAVSDHPDRGFVYQGVLVSNANIYPGDPERQKPQNYWGNNHGGILQLGDEYYIFYHRHTNKSGWNRQGCVEKLTRRVDGGFEQAETTSLGLRQEPFPAVGEHGAYIACLLQKKDPQPYQPFQFYELTEADPCITEDEETQFITNLTDGARAGYRYLAFDGTEKEVYIRARGTGVGKIVVSTGEGSILAEIDVAPAAEWQQYRAEMTSICGKQEVILTYQGEGSIDLLSFGFEG